MKVSNYINREVVNPVDLNVLGRTYDTLEQGHQEAVKAASNLQVTMASLDLNEAEAEWRQGKVAEIEQTVADNTTYGNAYGALDDIIAKAGNIASDHGMIGRLQAQKDFKTYREGIDKRADLPEDYKEYFREKNPYQYADKVDKDSGKVIGGTKWQPATSPTNVIPLNELINQGIKWAAKESGGGEQTRWIDSSGAVTSDPSKAFDGQVYNSTTNQWERLSKEKIRQGVMASIASTPGAKESISQDYTIAKWKHDKQPVDKDGKPVHSDITDKNGILLNETEYLNKRIDPAIASASYYNSVSKTNYGSGLATYKAASRAAAAASATPQGFDMKAAMIGGKDTPVDVPIDVASNFVAVKNTTAQGLKDTYKKLTGNELFIGDGKVITGMEDILQKRNIPPAVRQEIRSLTKTYNDSVKNLNAFTAKMSPEDRAQFDFASRMKSGGELKSSKNGGSKYDDQGIKAINDIYRDGDEIRINISNDVVKNSFINSLNGGRFDGYKELGIIQKDGTFVLPKNKMYALPKILSALENGRAEANKGVFGTIMGVIDSRYSIDTMKGGKLIQSNNPKQTSGGGSSFNPLDSSFGNIISLYDKASDLGTRVSTKYNINPKSMQISSLNLDGKTFTEGALLDQYNKGILSKQDYDIQKKYYSDSFDDILSNTDFSQMDMFSLGEKDNVKRRVADGAERFNNGAEILQGVKDKRVTVSPSVVPGMSDPISGAPISGYNITVLPKDGKGAIKKFYIPGLVNETASKTMMQDPTVQAFSTVTTLGATKTSRSLTDSNVNPKLGSIVLQGLGDNKFMVDFNGTKKQLTQESAVTLTTSLNNYNAVKSRFLSESFDKPQHTLDERSISTIKNAAINISKITGFDAAAVAQQLINDINK